MQNPGTQGLWVDTVIPNLDAYVHLYIKKILGLYWLQCKYSKAEHVIYFPNHSVLHMRSATKPENMEGFEYQYIVVNEAGIVLKNMELWTKTIMPMTKRGIVKFIGTPKGINGFHELSLNCKVNDNWGLVQLTAYDSPYWTAQELDAIRSDPSVPEDVWRQEYLAEFTTTSSNVICKDVSRDLYRDKDDVNYTFDHRYVQQLLAGQGYYFVFFDGGMQTTHTAAVAGYYNSTLKMYVVLKEFCNTMAHQGTEYVATIAHDYIKPLLASSQKSLYLAGDPALNTYLDSEIIQNIFSKEIDCLDSLRNADNPEVKACYSNRKTKRLGRLLEVLHKRINNLPQLIFCKDECQKMYEGIYAGKYRYEIKDGKINTDLEQIAPITDIIDALTYGLLSIKPLA